MSEAGARRPRGKVEVFQVSRQRPGLGAYWDSYWLARFAEGPPGLEGTDCFDSDRAIADLHKCAAWLDARDARRARRADPVQNLMDSAASLASAVSGLGWRFRKQPTISPDGDVEMTLYLDEDCRSGAVDALLGAAWRSCQPRMS